MNTYYLVDEAIGGITPGHAIGQGFESVFAVKVRRNGLEAALKQLVALAARCGKKRNLEIHCHGLPATLLLGDERAVTNGNVREFGTTLKQVIMPGGMIELLACKVAAPGDGYGVRRLLSAPKANIADYREEYHGAIRLRKTRNYSPKNSDGTINYYKALYDNEFTERTKKIEDDPMVSFIPDFATDGLRFCLTLAASSSCTVRAAFNSQEEEGEDSLFGSPIGNWEYEVFDFSPGGGIKFLGTSPSRRQMINIFDQPLFRHA